MATTFYMPLFVSDYFADTAHLTTLEHGAYLLLIMTYWQTGKPLDNSNGRLANVVRMSNDCWVNVETTLSKFFKIEGEKWHHKRVDAELRRLKDKKQKASAAGKISANQRAINGRSTDVQQNVNHLSKVKLSKDVKDISLAKASSPDAKASACPYEAIVSLYHEVLPNHPRVKEVNEKRRRDMKARWNNGMEKNMEIFREYFQAVLKSRFLTARVDPPVGRKRFIADFDFLMKEKTYLGILEGKYRD